MDALLLTKYVTGSMTSLHMAPCQLRQGSAPRL